MSRVIALLLADNRLTQWLQFGLEQQGYLVLASEDAAHDLRQPDAGLLAWRPDLWLVSGRFQTLVRQSRLRTARGSDSEWRFVADGGVLPERHEHELWPVSPRALLLRLHQDFAARREPEATVLEHGALRLDVSTQTAHVGHLQLPLSSQSLRLLALLMQYPGRVFSRQHLLDAIWEDYGSIEARSVDAQVYRLRRQLEACGHGHLLESVRGQGYRLRLAPPAAEQASAAVSESMARYSF